MTSLIEIIPPSQPVEACITVPGSKSITNRAMVLAALNDGTTELRGALWSEDTQVMVECLKHLGFEVKTALDPQESCNRTITVKGLGGRVPAGGTVEAPLELFVGNAGTTARFLAAMVCLGSGVYRLHGVPRMHERPQAELFAALRELGYVIDTPNDKLPALIHGGGPRKAGCRVSVDESSQFASALLLAARAGGWTVELLGRNNDESPYVDMTRSMCQVFPQNGGVFQIEPDASSGSYFWGADQVSPAHSRITVAHWPTSGWQIDARFPRYLPLPEELCRKQHLGDAIMTAIVLAPFASQPCRFINLDRLRLQECERVQALRTELQRCGAVVSEVEDTLEITPSPLHGAEIETYNDHRMAMCFAILGLKVPGIRIKMPSCVKKTFPNFFQKLAAPMPGGLGVQIRDGLTGKPLPADALFAD